MCSLEKTSNQNFIQRPWRILQLNRYCHICKCLFKCYNKSEYSYGAGISARGTQGGGAKECNLLWRGLSPMHQ